MYMYVTQEIKFIQAFYYHEKDRIWNPLKKSNEWRKKKNNHEKTEHIFI